MASPSLSSPQTCRVLIADDHPIVRSSLRCLLEAAPMISVVAEAGDGEDTLEKIAQFQPDVALVDISMPKLNGIEVARRVAGSNQRTRVLAVTAFEDGPHVRDSLAAGAAGFVPKTAAAQDLIAAIHAVAGGGRYVHPRVMTSAIASIVNRDTHNTCLLSARESEVLRLIALGYSNKEVSEHLSVSVKTVETYKKRGMDKIDASSRVDLVRYASSCGWLGSGAS